jgi:hypothetical protein
MRMGLAEYVAACECITYFILKTCRNTHGRKRLVKISEKLIVKLEGIIY